MSSIVGLSSSSSSFVLLESYQYYIIFFITTVSCTLSLIGSFAITIASCKNFDSIYQRLIFMISIADMISSTSYLFHPLLLPEWVQSYGLLFAIGNTTTCNVAGYLLSVCPLLVTFYSFYMSIYFYTKVKYNVTDDYIKKKKYHYIANTIALSISIILPILIWIYVGYRPAPFWNVCYFGKCQIGENLNTECTFNAHDITVVIGIIYVTITTTLVTSSQITMFLVYWTVRQTLLKNQLLYKSQFSNHNNNNTSDNNFNNSSEMIPNGSTMSCRQNSSDDLMIDINNHKELNSTKIISKSIMMAIERSTTSSINLKGNNNDNQRKINHNNRKDMKRIKDVRTQGFLYAIVYWNSCFWTFLVLILEMSGKTEQTVMQQYNSNRSGYTVSSMILICVAYVMFPLQGFLNFLVYTRPRYIEYRAAYKEQNRFYAFRKACSLQPVIFHTNCHNNSLSKQSNSSRRFHNQQLYQQQEQQQYLSPLSSNLCNDDRMTHDGCHYNDDNNYNSNNMLCRNDSNKTEINNNNIINIIDVDSDDEGFFVVEEEKEKDDDTIIIDFQKNDDNNNRYNNNHTPEDEIIFFSKSEEEEGVIHENNNGKQMVVAKYLISNTSSHEQQTTINE